MIVKDADHTIKALVYEDDAEVTPDTWTVTVYNASNVSVETGSGSGQASHTIGSADLTAEAIGESWRVEWSIVIGSDTITPRNDAMLVLNGLWPVVSSSDLERRNPALVGTNKITTTAHSQEMLDEAWLEIQLRILASGRRPYLVLEPSALRLVHMHLAMHLIYNDLAARDDQWMMQADKYHERYERAWSELNPRTDDDHDGVQDGKRPMQPVYWLGGGGTRNGGWL